MTKFLDNHILYLRAPEPEDLEILYKWENDTEVWRFGSAISPYSKYILKQYIEDAQTDIFQSKQLRFMITLHKEQNTVGTIDLYDFDVLNSRCGVGIYIDPEWRKCGLATQALTLLQDYVFYFLKINQLYAIIPESNNTSIQLFESGGFSKTGILQQWVSYDDIYENAIIVQKLKSDKQ